MQYDSAIIFPCYIITNEFKKRAWVQKFSLVFTCAVTRQVIKASSKDANFIERSAGWSEAVSTFCCDIYCTSCMWFQYYREPLLEGSRISIQWKMKIKA